MIITCLCVHKTHYFDQCTNYHYWMYCTDLLFVQFFSFQDKNFSGIGPVLLKGHKQATRNCPWVKDFWLSYVQVQEKMKVPHEEIIGTWIVKELMEQDKWIYNAVCLFHSSATFDSALGDNYSDCQSYLDLWTSYCDYLRRRTSDLGIILLVMFNCDWMFPLLLLSLTLSLSPLSLSRSLSRVLSFSFSLTLALSLDISLSLFFPLVSFSPLHSMLTPFIFCHTHVIVSYAPFITPLIFLVGFYS